MKCPILQMPYILLAILFNQVLLAQTTTVIEQGYIGLGYDLLKGNPDGIPSQQYAIDPGLKVLYPIFKTVSVDQFENHDTKIGNVEYQSISSCSQSKSVSVFDGTDSYLDKLDVSVDVAGN